MPPLKIFACTSYGPHTALTGGRLRRDNVLAALVRRGHTIDRLDVPARPGVRSALAAGRLALTSSFRDRARRADVVLLGDVFCLPMMPVLRQIGCKTVVDLVDSPYRLVGAAPRVTVGQWVSASAQAAQLLPVMQGLLPMADGVTYISAEDRDVDAARVCALPPALVVPNGVQSDLFDVTLTTPPDEGYLAWLADWTYAPNRESYAWFVDEVAPLLSDDVLTKVRTFGAGDPRRSRNGDENGQRVHRLVTHAGFVDPLSAVYNGARGIVAPVVRGAGVNNKVLEPLAVGRPVVTTAVGTRGLPPTITAHLRVGATGDGFASAMLDLLAKPFDEAEAFSARTAVASLSWDTAGEAMEGALHAALAVANPV
ncbi:hypothetical protein GCM10017691_62420 [Pseudonocardia petroleophila]|uniref:Glycosyltransferase n=1 Tax=Pseudonocardia petroleophila TaxID=37331 RepID=A0A7G7MLY8_9PSEU|nr:glycosyltransferase [Pseudonocardia petroleophila]QNG53799.1 glycosyltransferase [Pseudonocardia petroleophila]